MKSKRSGRRTNTLRLYWIASFGVAIILALMLWGLLSLDPLLSWLIAINLIAFLMYGYDKRIAGSGRMRVPEALLLALAYTGGSLGALAGMYFFHHKTSKTSFQARFWLIVAIQIVLIAFYVVVILPAISG
jgi:uncharacterized membrane protein YsdA (DUF1294 family)